MSERSHLVRPGEDPGHGPVLHWMRREFRVADNPGLLFALARARDLGAPLGVVVCPDASAELPSRRQLRFLLDGLPALEKRLRGLGVAFFLRPGDPAQEVAGLVRACGARLLSTDFDPLRPASAALDGLLRRATLPVWETDGRNIVPCRLASDKKEYMARTLRPKLQRLLPEFLSAPPRPVPASVPWPDDCPETDWIAAGGLLRTAFPAPPVEWVRGAAAPGEDEARARLERFVQNGLRGYATRRNDPVQDASSRLSPWLHFGFLSALRAARLAAASDAPREDKDAFLEELIVRRELADNFCLYEPGYDSLAAAADWARATLDKHRADKRSYLYDFDVLERGETHQPLWNAAQRQLVDTGFLHGYLRMYWAKKILEWSAGPEEALATVIRLNDRWSLDGMDSNGYAGAAWSVCGVHDRGWPERPVFGTVRYMNANGARRKFDAVEYVRRHAGPEQARAFAARR